MKRITSVGLLATFLVSLSSLAQDYPSRRITLLVGYSAGGPVDVAARLLAERLRDSLNQPVIVENRIGGGPLLSFETVNRTPAAIAVWTAVAMELAAAETPEELLRRLNSGSHHTLDMPAAMAMAAHDLFLNLIKIDVAAKRASAQP